MKELRGFLGLTGYYRRFIQGYSQLAAPLTNSLNKDEFQWSDQIEKSFKSLKEAMTKSLVLRLPDFSSTFVVETNTSNCGIGAVLMQHEQPVALFSKHLGHRLQGASTYHRELCAIVQAIQKWRQYLLGRPFVVRTYHKNLGELLQQIIQSPDQQIYVRKLMGYDFHIEYKLGSSNKVADALSRKEEHTTLQQQHANLFWTYN